MLPLEVAGLGRVVGVRTLLAPLDLAVGAGQIVGLLGANGSGKTTALHRMVQLSRGPGRALFNGRQYKKLQHPQRSVGVVLSDCVPPEGRKPLDHLRLVAALAGVRAQRVSEVAELVALPQTARTVGELSAGGLQRLRIAAALLGEPNILLLDEPERGLDHAGREWLWHALRGLAGSGCSILVASHHRADGYEFFDDLVMLDEGVVIARGTPEQLAVAMSGRSTVRVRSSPDGLVKLRSVLDADGVVYDDRDGCLIVEGMTDAQVGTLAHDVSAPVLHLSYVARLSSPSVTPPGQTS